MGAPPVLRPRLRAAPALPLPEREPGTLHTFEQKLDLWFHRADIPIWISEYGFETRPGRAGGVSVAQQAAYVRQSLAIAAADPRVQMFIWFVLRDDPSMSTWDSGLIGDTGAHKPSFDVFADAAAPLDARDPLLTCGRERPGRCSGSRSGSSRSVTVPGRGSAR